MRRLSIIANGFLPSFDDQGNNEDEIHQNSTITPFISSSCPLIKLPKLNYIEPIAQEKLPVFRYNQNSVLSYGMRSRPGMLINGTQKINQDSYSCRSNFAKIKNCLFFGIFDGHGVNGHLVSNLIKYYIPSFFCNNYS